MNILYELERIAKECKAKYPVLEDTPENERRQVVDLYHIDSELGLYIFVQMLKQEGLV